MRSDMDILQKYIKQRDGKEQNVEESLRLPVKADPAYANANAMLIHSGDSAIKRFLKRIFPVTFSRSAYEAQILADLVSNQTKEIFRMLQHIEHNNEVRFSLLEQRINLLAEYANDLHTSILTDIEIRDNRQNQYIGEAMQSIDEQNKTLSSIASEMEEIKYLKDQYENLKKQLSDKMDVEHSNVEKLREILVKRWGDFEKLYTVYADNINKQLNAHSEKMKEIQNLLIRISSNSAYFAMSIQEIQQMKSPDDEWIVFSDFDIKVSEFKCTVKSSKRNDPDRIIFYRNRQWSS